MSAENSNEQPFADPKAAQPSSQPSSEPAAAAGPAEPAVDEVARAREKQELAQAQKRVDELTRAYASLLNEQKEFRARLERQTTRELETQRGNVALHLLEVADELDRALAAARGEESPLAQGVKMIREALQRRLSGMGIERMTLVDTLYDPALAEVIEVVATPEAGRNDHVVEELLPGYRLGERVLRAAKVRVGRYVPPAAPAPQSPEAPSGE